MKYIRIFTVIVLCLMSVQSHAVTWWVGEVLFGNVCRAGDYYTVYPIANGQPVGTECPVRDMYGNVIAYGYVSNE